MYSHGVSFVKKQYGIRFVKKQYGVSKQVVRIPQMAFLIACGFGCKLWRPPCQRNTAAARSAAEPVAHQRVADPLSCGRRGFEAAGSLGGSRCITSSSHVSAVHHHHRLLPLPVDSVIERAHTPLAID
jgi:hypothetical protein